MLGALIAVAIGIFVPLAAPALMIAAAVSFGIGVLAVIPYLVNFISAFLNHPQTLGLYSDFEGKNLIGGFFEEHPVQGIVFGLTVGLFITALVLTIGFFTGGVGFAFMGPIFAAISSPFAMAAASAHVSLFLPALAGFCFVMAPLVVGNNLKRFLSWLDSFKYDAFASEISDDYSDKATVRRGVDKKMKEVEAPSYFKAVLWGAVKTIQNDFSSPHQDKMDNDFIKL